MLVERTEYFAKPGLADKVLAIRRRACAVRVELGLAAGRVFVRTETSDPDAPDVVWECSFVSAGAHAEDLAARATSAAFSAVRTEMTQQLARFARHVLRSDPEPLANGLAWVDLHDRQILPREMSFRSGGFALAGYFFAPPGPGPFPCMIVNHGSGVDQGSLDVSRPGAAARLMSWGVACFLPHRRGYGNSEGPAWRTEAPAAFGSAEYDEQVANRLDRESDDVIAALNHVATLPEVSSDHIGVMGSSFGGVNTLLAAAKTNRFRCAVDFAGAAMNWDRTPKLRALMTEAARRITTPIFLIQAENDYSIRPTRELAATLAGAGKQFQAKIYPAFGFNQMEAHLFESAGGALWGEDVRRFLERRL